jgi:catechol 2,3-dioxygenase-like lactoylglutathione lyase family enzyme
MRFNSLEPRLHLADFQRSIAFYRDVLGFERGEDAHYLQEIRRSGGNRSVAELVGPLPLSMLPQFSALPYSS